MQTSNQFDHQKVPGLESSFKAQWLFGPSIQKEMS